MNLRIHHIGLVVDDVDKTKALYENIFGMEEKGRYRVDAFNADCCFLLAGNTYLELVRPLADDGLGRFLEKRGTGTLHHICYITDDMDQAFRYFTEEKGLRSLSESPKEAPSFEKAVFFHPKDTGNLLVELVSDAACPLP
jgi:methylmalonyl-CoA/ethylmalonyl-CoA epimerase